MYIVIVILLTVLNIMIFFANHLLIKHFKLNQVDFINQQNRNAIDILNIKDELKGLK